MYKRQVHSTPHKHAANHLSPCLLWPMLSNGLLQDTKKARLWGGRFRTDTDPVMEKFNDSLRFDR